MRHRAINWCYIFLQALILFIMVPHIYGAEKIDINIVGSEEWVKEKLEAYPELTWLLSEEVDHTQEGTSAQQESSWSWKLTGSHYPEFERTIATLVNFYLLMDGSDKAFNRFIEAQQPEEALTRENFNTFHTYVRNLVANNGEIVKTIEVDLILGDMGKTPKARALAKAYSIEEKDHDIFLRECLKKCPQIFPTFEQLPPPLQSDIRESNGLVHFGHVTHLEGGPEILKKLKDSKIVSNNPRAFDLLMVTYMLDVSGARAHEANRGSKSFTNKTFLAINGMREALYKLAKESESNALSSYVDFRAKLLGLESGTKEGRLLGRMGAMMRLFTPEEGQALKTAYQHLKKEQKAVFEQAFDPLKKREERTPTYMPAVFVNFLDTAVKEGMSKEEAIQKCLGEVAVHLANFLQKYRMGEADQPYNLNQTLNFNKSAGQMRSNIRILENHVFSMDKDWNVFLS